MNNINIELTQIERDVLKCNIDPQECGKCSFKNCNKESFKDILNSINNKLR